MKHIAIHPSGKRAIIPFDKDVVEAMPDRTEHVEKNGRKYLVVPTRIDEMRILENCGYEPNYMVDYDWRGIDAFDVQKVTAKMMVRNHRGYVLNDMGTGKTLASLFAYDYLRRAGIVRRMLVIAPLSIITTTWEREVFRFMPDLSTISLWHPQRKQRLKRLQEDADIYLCNHDGINTIKDELRDREDLDVILIDELTACRNPKTVRWRAINSVAKHRRVIWGLTGSPMPRSPMDAFGQIKMITPQNTTQYKYQFEQATMIKVGFKAYPRKDAYQYVYRQMQPAVRFKRSECIDLPPTTYSERTVEFTPEQKKIYKKLVDEYAASHDNKHITAANAAVRAGKLLQVGCGFAYDEQKQPLYFNATPRVNELCELIDECKNKLLIFSPFVANIVQLTETLKAKGYDIECVYGKVNKTKRDELFGTFQHSNKIKALLCHPTVTSHGLTLTAADTVVWYCPTYSLETYEQANARVTRPGQANHTHIVHLRGSPVDARIYRTLRERGNMQQTLLGLFENDDGITTAKYRNPDREVFESPEI